MKSKIKSDKIEYSYGVNCCIWIPFEEDDEESGVCFDFKEDMIDDMISELQDLKTREATKYEPDEEYEKQKKLDEEKESKWYYKFWERWLEDIAIQFRPFEWEFTLKNRPIFYSIMTKRSGISIGPFKITLPKLMKD